MFRGFLIFISYFLICSTSAQNQNLNFRGEFLKDSVKIGEPIPYSLSLLSPKNRDILLPDSTADFGNFEFYEQTWFESKLRGNRVFDSAIYYLVTFEVDPIQSFAFEFYSWNGQDSTLHVVEPDTLFLQYIVSTIPDSLSDVKLMEQAEYYRVEPPFNTPFLISGIIIIIIIVVLIYVLFGKKIKAWWQIRRMKIRHKSFIDKYNKLYVELEKENIRTTTEKLLVHWKKYTEKLEGVPYPKLTTKEIREITGNTDLSNCLSEIDKAIYAGNTRHPVKESFEKIKNFSTEVYRKKVEELKYGK